MHATLQTKLSCLPREVKARVTRSAVEYPGVRILWYNQ